MTGKRKIHNKGNAEEYKKKNKYASSERAFNNLLLLPFAFGFPLKYFFFFPILFACFSHQRFCTHKLLHFSKFMHEFREIIVIKIQENRSFSRDLFV